MGHDWGGLKSAPLCVAEFEVGGGLVALGKTAFGERRLGYVTGGTFEGERLKGEILPGGGNWSTAGRLGADKAVGTFDARAVWRTHDGALIYLTYTGRSVIPDDVGAAFRDPAREAGVSPMTEQPFPWRDGDRVRRIGIAAGMLTPSTGYALTRILDDCAAMVRRLKAGGDALAPPRNSRLFRLLDRVAVDALLRLPERHRFVRGMVSWVGFRQIGVPYDRAPRLVGETHYPLRKMLKLAFDGITSFSSAPLQIATSLGMFAALLAMGLALWALYLKLFTHATIQGWTSTLLVILFLGSGQLLGLGIIGQYLGRIYDEVKARPLYFVARTSGFADRRGEGPPTP